MKKYRSRSCPHVLRQIWMYGMNQEVRTVIEFNSLHRSITLTFWYKGRKYISSLVPLKLPNTILVFSIYKTKSKKNMVLTIKFWLIWKDIQTQWKQKIKKCLYLWSTILGRYCSVWFSLNRPHWVDSVIESLCPTVCGSAPSGAVFF